MSALQCGLVVDGSAAMLEDIAHGLAVVPLHIRIADREFVDDGNTGTYAAFYRELRLGGNPITSTPAPGEYLEAFRKLDVDHIVCLTIPARWSGMFHSATIAAGMLAETEGRTRVTVVETPTAIGGLALVARAVAEVCASGAGVDTVLARVRAASSDVQLYGALMTLTYVARSGRVNALIAGISNSLHVRPVFRLQNGDPDRVALTRTASGAVDALERAAVERLDSIPQWLLVYHADAGDDAAALARRLAAATKVARTEVVELSPIGGAYTGPGAFGFAALPAGEALPAARPAS
ncbi:MAG TPA: DegV family protein [Candidatus Dormibacteraeota bacterium]